MRNSRRPPRSPYTSNLPVLNPYQRSTRRSFKTSKSTPSLNFREMMPLMMIGAMQSKHRTKKRGAGQVSSEIKNRIQQLAEHQQNLLNELSRTNQPSYNDDKLIRRLNDLDRKLERARKMRLRKKEKGGMPKFMMFMQQNMMNQMMMASQMNEPANQMDSFPRIIPVPIDPRKRILPLTTNPFINFERNQPKTDHKDIDLDYRGLAEIMKQDDEKMIGEEQSKAESNSSGSGSYDSSQDLGSMDGIDGPPSQGSGNDS